MTEYDHESSQAERALLNNEDNVNGHSQPNTNGTFGYWVIFPELREIDGAVAFWGSTSGMYARGDSTITNPFASGWAQSIASGSTPDGGLTPDDRYRDVIVSMAESSRRGVACFKTDGGGNKLRAWHIYGEISAGETPDKIIWIDEGTGLDFALPIDYGDVPRGSSEDFEVRLRNDSATLTANTVQYTAESLHLGAAGWFTFTLPGGSSYAATQQIASISAATTSGIINIRRITPATEATVVFAARSYANVSSWT
jgi:hypothetical protein